MNRARLAVLAIGVLLVAGCGTSGPPTPRPTLHLAPFPAGGGPGPAGSAEPSGSEAGGSSGPGDSGGPVGSAGSDQGSAGPSSVAGDTLPPTPSASFPDPPESQLLTHVDPTVRSSCSRAGPFYPGELASLQCGDGVKVPFVDYTLFGNQADMAGGYADDVAHASPQPTAGVACTTGAYEDGYLLRGRVSGRIWCGTGSSGGATYRQIEWTRDSLLIIGLIQTFDLSWPTLEAFWRTHAGPIG